MMGKVHLISLCLGPHDVLVDINCDFQNDQLKNFNMNKSTKLSDLTTSVRMNVTRSQNGFTFHVLEIDHLLEVLNN